MGTKYELVRRPSAISSVMPSSLNLKWRVGSSKGELMIGFSMITWSYWLASVRPDSVFPFAKYLCIMEIYKIVVDLARIVGFQWDEGNARKSFDKHGVSQSEAEQVFFNGPFLVVEDVEHSRPELRFHALGVTNSGRQLHVTFTLRGEYTKIRVISARDMHRKERSRYEKET